MAPGKHGALVDRHQHGADDQGGEGRAPQHGAIAQDARQAPTLGAEYKSQPAIERSAATGTDATVRRGRSRLRARRCG